MIETAQCRGDARADQSDGGQTPSRDSL